MMRVNLLDFFYKFRRYLTIGLLNTLFNFSLMKLGEWCGLGYMLYTALGYSVTILLSFFMNLWYTFKIRDRAMHRLFGFLLVSFSNLMMVEWIQYQLIEVWFTPRWFAIIVGMGWYVLVGFMVNNFVIYRQSRVV